MLRRPLPAGLTAAALLAAAAAQSAPTAGLRPVPFPEVTVADSFFAPRRATNRTVTLAHSLRQLEATGTLGNFDRAAAGARDGHEGFVYQDSDAYKAVEAIAFALAADRDPVLEAQLDAVIARIARSQQPDGYLNSWFTVKAPDRRFTNLRDDHELYCAGHLFEAAVAHWQATGKRTLLDVAVRFADLLVRTFGPGDGQRPGYCGHPEVELALVKLAAATGEPRYFELAHHFVRNRGSRFFAVEHRQDPATYDGGYWLDHAPVASLTAIAGHAVRATYLMAGATDVAARTHDAALLATVQRVWRNTIDKNVFVTGGIGPSASNEGFTVDYDLPTHSAYQESCASIALLMWAWRMNLLFGDARHADAMETALYNAIPAGVQLDGTRFFYENPLASHGRHHRREWFGCACCPPNLARTLAAVGGYAYARSDDGLWVNLYVRGGVATGVGGDPFGLEVATDYPWSGTVQLTVTRAPARAVQLHLRVPAWTTARCDAPGAASRRTPGGYLELRKSWQAGDVIRLELDFAVRRLEADPRAAALRGQVAFARGPIVYCGEQCDHEVALPGVFVPPGTEVHAEHRADLLGGVTVLTAAARTLPRRAWTDGLYRAQPAPGTVALTLVPYAVWDNRAPGAMQVWWPEAPQPAPAGGPETTARVAISFQHANCDPEAARDGEVPARSGDTPARNCHWWPHRGTAEWLQYEWHEPQTLAGSRVFWFDDEGRGACRLPAAAQLQWRDGEAWRPVAVVGGDLPLAKDRWCAVQFTPVTTTALRLLVQLQPQQSAGVLEWQVVPAPRQH